jgi:hypothetical protein
MPRVEFELTIPAFERPKTVHALDRAATVIGGLAYPSRIAMKITYGYMQWDICTTIIFATVDLCRIWGSHSGGYEELFSGMYRRPVRWKWTDVSEEHVAFIFSVEE